MQILQSIDRTSSGLEIAPYYNPVAPKRDGFHVMILDVFDTETLRARALDDPLINNKRVSDIEDVVNIVGSATEIRELIERIDRIGTLDFIVSSHNFEHSANPIKFLQGRYDALKLGGYSPWRYLMFAPVLITTAFRPNYRNGLKLTLKSGAPDTQALFEHNSIRSAFTTTERGMGDVGCDIHLNFPEFFVTY